MESIEKGFYYHFKHNPGNIFDHAYEVLLIGRDTETEKFVVVYRPLYELDFLENIAEACLRPVEMFNDIIERDGKAFSRFQKITDPEIIKKLEQKSREMYK